MARKPTIEVSVTHEQYRYLKQDEINASGTIRAALSAHITDRAIEKANASWVADRVHSERCPECRGVMTADRDFVRFDCRDCENWEDPKDMRDDADEEEDDE